MTDRTSDALAPALHPRVDLEARQRDELIDAEVGALVDHGHGTPSGRASRAPGQPQDLSIVARTERTGTHRNHAVADAVERAVAISRAEIDALEPAEVALRVSRDYSTRRIRLKQGAVKALVDEKDNSTVADQD